MEFEVHISCTHVRFRGWLLALLLLTLIGMICMKQGTSPPPLSFLDRILSAEFLSKNFQTFLEVKIDINRVNLTPCQAMLDGPTQPSGFSR